MKRKTLFGIGLVAFNAALIAVAVITGELYVRNKLNYKLDSYKLEKVNIYVRQKTQGDQRKLINKLYYDQYPSRFNAWPESIQFFDPVEKFGYKTTRPAYLFKPGAKTQGQRFNSFGFRGADIPEKKGDGVIRIFCVGSSTTFGQYGDDETYPYYLQQILGEMYPGQTFEVVNAGYPGLSATDLYVITKELVIPLEPDIIVYYEMGNGVNEWEAVVMDPAPPVYPIWSRWRHHDWLISHSAIYAELAERLRLTYPPRKAWYDPSRKSYSSMKIYEKAVRDLVQEAKARGVRMVMSSLANGYHDGLWSDDNIPEGVFWLYKRFHPLKGGAIGEWYAITSARMRVIAREFDVPYVDIFASFPRKDKTYYASYGTLYDPGHYSPKGNKLLARLMAKFIAERYLDGILKKTG